jgi:hypothetical protein
MLLSIVTKILFEAVVKSRLHFSVNFLFNNKKKKKTKPFCYIHECIDTTRSNV